GVTTRNGLVHFIASQKTTFPISYNVLENSKWKELKATPLFDSTDPLSIMDDADLAAMKSFSLINVPKQSVPRQGINTCGANDIFYFDDFTHVDDTFCRVSNDFFKEILLPQSFVFPVAKSINFSHPNNDSILKWVLLPYDNKG